MDVWIRSLLQGFVDKSSDVVGGPLEEPGKRGKTDGFKTEAAIVLMSSTQHNVVPDTRAVLGLVMGPPVERQSVRLMLDISEASTLEFGASAWIVFYASARACKGIFDVVIPLRKSPLRK